MVIQKPSNPIGKRRFWCLGQSSDQGVHLVVLCQNQLQPFKNQRGINVPPSSPLGPRWSVTANHMVIPNPQKSIGKPLFLGYYAAAW